jgi:hypothetical protein
MHEARGELHTRLSERRLILAAMTLSALCLAYLYLLDRFLFSSAHFSPIFRFLLMSLDRQSAWLVLLVCVLAAAWNRPAAALKCVDLLACNPKRAAAAYAACCAVGAFFVYRNHPLSMDEYAAVFQSKILASGSIFARLPRDLVDWLVVRGFNGEFLIASHATGLTIGQYWPGFSLLLTPFQFLSVPWACNAVVSGCAIFLVFWITRKITADARAAGWSMLFTMASGVFAADGISYYSMQAHLCANLLFAALLIQPSNYHAFGAGLVGSVALNLHNPVPHTLFALPWIAAAATQPERRRQLLPLACGYLPGVLIGASWLLLRSDLASNGHGTLMLRGADAAAFVWPDAALMNTRAAALAKMWIWAMPGLFVLAILGWLRHRANPCIRLLMQSAVLTFLGYLFVRFDQGHGWGYRYFHSAWGVVPILAGSAMSANASKAAGGRLRAFAGAAAILSLLIVVPVQLAQIHRFISGQLSLLEEPRRPGNNVYFIHPRGGFYAADLVQFDPGLREPDLKLVSHGVILDTELIKRNWPAAIKLAGTPAADHWYLGPIDQRAPAAEAGGERRWAISSVPSPPSAADR